MLVYTARRLDESGSRTDGAVHGLAERHLRRARTGFEEPNPQGRLIDTSPDIPKGRAGPTFDPAREKSAIAKNPCARGFHSVDDGGEVSGQIRPAR